MKASDLPTRFPKFWGAAAGGGFIRNIPVDSQIGITDGAASLTDGWPPLTMTPDISGGVPPFGQDANGILRQVTQWTQWQNAGGAVPWDSTFSTAIGGYPKGAVVAASTFGYFWLCLIDDNTTNPDTGGTNWGSFSFLGGATTGDAKLTLKTTADPSWVLANDGSLGDVSSGGTTRANVDTAALFALLWNNVSNSFAQVQDSSGTPIARGVSAAADFAAQRRILVPNQLGRALIVAGAGFGLTSRALGDGTIGAEANAILQANLPNLTLSTSIASGQGSHNHSLNNAGSVICQDGAGLLDQTLADSKAIRAITANAATLPAMTGTTPTGGSGTPLSVMQPSTAWNVMIKL